MTIQLTKLQLAILGSLLKQSQTLMDVYLNMKASLNQQELTVETVEQELASLVTSGKMYIASRPWANKGQKKISSNRL
jgi:hypothetical protein